METDKAEGGVLEADPHAEHINVCTWTDSVINKLRDHT